MNWPNSIEYWKKNKIEFIYLIKTPFSSSFAIWQINSARSVQFKTIQMVFVVGFSTSFALLDSTAIFDIWNWNIFRSFIRQNMYLERYLLKLIITSLSDIHCVVFEIVLISLVFWSTNCDNIVIHGWKRDDTQQRWAWRTTVRGPSIM